MGKFNITTASSRNTVFKIHYFVLLCWVQPTGGST